MSSAEEFDFWEFVSCAKCHISFSSEKGPTVPFWLTECGHVVCNNHLNADQSCVQCASPGIQLIPLQREMELPMSNWFRSIPTALDAIAFASKFQQEAMAAQIRYYKSKMQQYRGFIDQLKREIVELKRVNENLTQQSSQLHRRPDHNQVSYRDPDLEPSDATNSNGKRKMIVPHLYLEAPKTASSPRSITTPLRPSRITLPQSQQGSKLSSNRYNQQQDTDEHNPQSIQDTSLQHRTQQHMPGSSHFAEQYAYTGHSPSQRGIRHGKTTQTSQKQDRYTTIAPSKLRPTQPHSSSSNKRPSLFHGQQNGHFNDRVGLRSMGPPPVPQQGHQEATDGISAHADVPPPRRRNVLPSNSFLASNAQTQRFVAVTPSASIHRLIPGTSSGPMLSFHPLSTNRNVPPSARAQTPASAPSIPSDRQRRPFFPSGQNGLG